MRWPFALKLNHCVVSVTCSVAGGVTQTPVLGWMSCQLNTEKKLSFDPLTKAEIPRAVLFDRDRACCRTCRAIRQLVLRMRWLFRARRRSVERMRRGRE